MSGVRAIILRFAGSAINIGLQNDAECHMDRILVMVEPARLSDLYYRYGHKLASLGQN